jgi:spore coat protein U-like protein
VKISVKLPATLLLLVLSPLAHAASCQISASDLAFGAYRFNSPSDIDSTATITVGNCSIDGGGATVTYTIAIDAGSGMSFSPRSMSGPGGPLFYNLFVDPSRSLVWGDDSAGTLTLSGSIALPAITSATHVVFGRIPAHQNGISPGVYADHLVITLSY